MKINHSTPLHAIAERMGDCATETEAAAMASILVRENVIDTADVSEADWLRYCDEAVAVAASFRCAYYDTGTGDAILLTRREDAALPDAELRRRAIAEAECAGLVALGETDPARAAPRLTDAQLQAGLEIGRWPN
ncbi:MAG: hypothetical protein EHM87_14320 [Burkholderiales bacterium]|nr:MAG: hypothetical protein EHM87_14320 [Burkholderiales bacterium]